jgi:two-component SAPR family response regulator
MEAENVKCPIKIYTLGRFTIENNDACVGIYSKSQKKPLELLKVLLALGGREVHIEKMADDLWPESEGDSSYNVLGVTLHRLRKLLGDNQAIQMHDRKLALNPRICWVDVWEFERLLNVLESLFKMTHPCVQAVNENINKIFELYHGTFMVGETSSAAIIKRERLRSKFLHSLNTIGRYWEESGNWIRAKECYQKGLETDPMLESLYQRLMICHREMGQRAEALIAYQRCHFNLSALLNIPPSSQTEDIRRSLISD